MRLMNPRRVVPGVLSAVLAFGAALPARPAAAAKVGEPAPAFSAVSAQGKPVALAKLAGKYVVLEWHNQDCPFTKAQYDAHRLQADQKQWTAKGVVWITVISSAKGKEGYVDAKGALSDIKRMDASPTYTLLDPTGKIGHAYGAKTTPHMFVIDPKGNLMYEGAIDDHPTTRPSEVNDKVNYVSDALTEAMAGMPVSRPGTRPFGCSIKY